MLVTPYQHPKNGTIVETFILEIPLLRGIDGFFEFQNLHFLQRLIIICFRQCITRMIVHLRFILPKR